MQCGGTRTGEEPGERGVAMVESTRRGVEAMEVASDGIPTKGPRDGVQCWTRLRDGRGGGRSGEEEANGVDGWRECWCGEKY
jgi:hypothetical protein